MRGSAGFSPRKSSRQIKSGFSRGHFDFDLDSGFMSAPPQIATARNEMQTLMAITRL
jgi:hypothetical protein